MKKTILFLSVLSLLAASAHAANYYLVLPSKGRTLAATTPPAAPISVALSPTALPSGLVGSGYSFNFTGSLAVFNDADFNGSGVTWSLISGGLPAGMTLSPEGVLSGTPSEPWQGTLTVRATYKNASGHEQYSVQVADLQVSLAEVTPTLAMVDKAYTFNLANLASSNDPTFNPSLATWSLDSGVLPSGLALSSEGVIAGTPSTNGSANFRAKVSYKNRFAVRDYTLRVDRAAGLLMGFDGAEGSTTFVDNSPYNLSFAAQGNARISAAQSIQGGTSAYFDGTSGTRVVSGNSAGMNFGTGDFTMEAWVRFNVVPSYYAHIFGKGDGVASNTYALAVYQSRFAWGISMQSPTILQPGTWYHVAASRKSGILRIFLNGVLQSTAADSNSYTSSYGFSIGDRAAGNPYGQYPFNGYVDNLRAVAGEAFYTSNFTPSLELPSY